VNALARPHDLVADKWLRRSAVMTLNASIVLMVTLGLEGPRAGKTTFSAAPPLPPWFFSTHPSTMLWSITLWLSELLGSSGLILALISVRRGWRPSPRRMITWSVVAVIILIVIPPVDNGDPTIYAAFGRMTVLGHSPYVMTPGQFRASGDPVGRVVSRDYWPYLSRYGPFATATEAAASELAGDSAARTIFWLKVWNGLAYLALVLALDRVTRSDPARRIRVHLLWSLNPLMLFALMANGHNDVLAAAAGASALLALRRASSLRDLLAGLLLGLAIAIKAQYALFGAGLAWAVRRHPAALAAAGLTTAAVLVPSYLLAGRAAISATLGLTKVAPTGPWLDVAHALGWTHEYGRINILALIGAAMLAGVLLWRMPSGARDLPAVRVALALALGLLICSPLQAVSYDAMLFPLLAVMPATRLDWIVVGRAAALTAASQPFLTSSSPNWLAVIGRISVGGSPTLSLAGIVLVLLWLCATRAWNPVISQTGPPIEGIGAELSSAQQ
jgi:hypothetical protein